MDPELEMREVGSYPDVQLASRGQQVHHFFTQPFKLWEHVTGLPGESNPYEELLDSVETMLTE